MLQEVLRWLGFGLCHQLPERSYFGGGVQAPVCARDTGIYVGFMIGFALISLLHRGERPRNFPKAYVWAVMAGLVAFMGWDGISSYSGLRATTNDLRLITGLGVGFSAAALVVPMLNDESWRVSGPGRVLDPPDRFWAWLVAIPASWLLIDFVGLRLGLFFPVLIAVAILFTLTAVNLVIVSMFPAFDRRANRWRERLLPIAISLAITLGEIALAAQLRASLLTFITRF